MDIDAALKAAKGVRLLLLDVDGVLTDGQLYYGDNGNEYKAFNTKDGLGIKMLQRVGIEVGIITARTSTLLTRRSKELGIEKIIQGREDKLAALRELLADSPLPMAEIAYMGDDLPDLAIINRVGLGMTVADANRVIVAHAAWQSRHPGGNGAVREAAEFILDAQGKLEPLILSYS